MSRDLIFLVLGGALYFLLFLISKPGDIKESKKRRSGGTHSFSPLEREKKHH